jgi:hypothetical protein
MPVLDTMFVKQPNPNFFYRAVVRSVVVAALLISPNSMLVPGCLGAAMKIIQADMIVVMVLLSMKIVLLILMSRYYFRFLIPC